MRNVGTLLTGVSLNLAVLGYYKYGLFGFNSPIIFPLAISFFTLQQIAFLVDTFRGSAGEKDFLRYCLFVTFFPQLIAGPILRYHQFSSQITEGFLKRVDKTDARRLSNIKRIRNADSSFNDLWERTRHIYPTTNIRNAKTINWNCFQNKEKEKVVLGYYEKDQLLGYVICKDSIVQGLKIFECTDYWVCPSSNKVEHALIDAVHNYAAETGYDCIIFLHFNMQLENTCNEMGLFSMNNKNRREFFKIKPEWFEKINVSNSYFVVQGDRAI